MEKSRDAARGVKLDFMTAKGEFAFEGEYVDGGPYGDGHINDTYALTYRDGDKTRRYILQRMNTHVFPDIPTLMHNIGVVTRYLSQKIEESGGDPERETLTLVPTRDGKNYLDRDGECWRAFLFIEDTEVYQLAESAEVFGDTGRAFGLFIARLDGFDASKLGEVIPNFHNTADRYAKFEAAVRANKSGRADMVKDEIEFVRARKEYCSRVVDGIADGSIPLRVTHNDTKLNNILFDSATKKALCVIDLDTIMPGSLLYDFGDAVRFGCSTALEDEPDLDKVHFDIALYEAFAKGFLAGIGDKITEKETKMLSFGSVLMTYECGMRFLTDFLDGDVYFKTKYDTHNLVRCHTQFKLVSEMEGRLAEMDAIAARYRKA